MKLLFTLLLCSVATLSGQSPAGQYQYSFTRDNIPLWDFSGVYPDSFGDAIGTNRITHLPNGRLVVSGSARMNTPGVFVESGGTGSGRVSISRGNIVGVISSRGMVTGNVNGRFISGTSTATSRLTFDSLGERFVGTTISRTCIIGARCIKVTRGISYDLQPAMDGSWTLGLNLTNATTNANTRMFGTGSVLLSNGRRLAYTITGNYNRRSNLAILRMIGTGDAKGTSLSIKVSGGSTPEITYLRGTLYGQRLKWP